MATITFTYTFDISDALAAEMQDDQTRLVYGCSALGCFLSAKRLPAVYSNDPHTITIERNIK